MTCVTVHTPPLRTQQTDEDLPWLPEIMNGDVMQRVLYYHVHGLEDNGVDSRLKPLLSTAQEACTA